MYSSCIFLVVVCVVSASAAPGFIGAYGPAVSHVSRVDIHNSKPIIAAYEAPIAIGAPAYPVGHSYGHYGIPAAHSYSNRVDIHSPSYVTPVLGGYYGQGYGHGYGHGYGGYGLHEGSGYGYAVHGYGVQGLHHGY